MKLRRIIGNATIPISGTVNPSGTATKILNFLKGAGTRVSAFVPGLSTVLDSGSNLLAKASEQAATRRTLDGILRYDGTPASPARSTSKPKNLFASLSKRARAAALSRPAST